MIYAVRFRDIPVLLIALPIEILCSFGMISLWKASDGFPDWLGYCLFIGSILFSLVVAKAIWGAILSSRVKK